MLDHNFSGYNSDIVVKALGSVFYHDWTLESGEQGVEKGKKTKTTEKKY